MEPGWIESRKQRDKSLGRSVGVHERCAGEGVLENKRRFQEDGFDLDLCYVAPSIIALSEPAETSQLNVNKREEVAAFLERSHAGRYQVHKHLVA